MSLPFSHVLWDGIIPRRVSDVGPFPGDLESNHQRIRSLAKCSSVAMNRRWTRDYWFNPFSTAIPKQTRGILHSHYSLATLGGPRKISSQPGIRARRHPGFAILCFPRPARGLTFEQQGDYIEPALSVFMIGGFTEGALRKGTIKDKTRDWRYLLLPFIRVAPRSISGLPHVPLTYHYPRGYYRQNHHVYTAVSQLSGAGWCGSMGAVVAETRVDEIRWGWPVCGLTYTETRTWTCIRSGTRPLVSQFCRVWDGLDLDPGSPRRALCLVLLLLMREAPAQAPEEALKGTECHHLPSAGLISLYYISPHS